jgi:hypothetical protein
MAGFPMEAFTSVERFSYSPTWIARLRSARAAGLGSNKRMALCTLLDSLFV